MISNSKTYKSGFNQRNKSLINHMINIIGVSVIPKRRIPEEPNRKLMMTQIINGFLFEISLKTFVTNITKISIIGFIQRQYFA